jgi:hypothetical protein
MRSAHCAYCVGLESILDEVAKTARLSRGWLRRMMGFSLARILRSQFSFPTGVAVDGAGNVYVADQVNQTIRSITSAGVVTTFAGAVGSYGSADGTGPAARFGNPVGWRSTVPATSTSLTAATPRSARSPGGGGDHAGRLARDDLVPRRAVICQWT